MHYNIKSNLTDDGVMDSVILLFKIIFTLFSKFSAINMFDFYC